MAPKPEAGSDNDFEFAGNTASADLEDDFDWANDELPAAAPPVTVKQGAIPFKAPAMSSTPPRPAAAAAAAGATPAVTSGPPAAPPAVPLRQGPNSRQTGNSPAATSPAAPAAGTSTGQQPAGGAAARAQPAPTGAQPKPRLVPPPASGGAAAAPAQPAAPPAAAVKPAGALSQSSAAGSGTPVLPGGTRSSADPSTAPAAGAQPAESAATGQECAAAPTAGTIAAPGAAAAAAASAASGDAVHRTATAHSSETLALGRTGPGSAAAAAAPPAVLGHARRAEAASPAVESSSSTAGDDTAAAGGAGKGWGSWLAPSGLGGFSSKLQQVAMGAAKDLQELTASVQQVVAEVVAADDITEVDRLAEYQARPVRQQQQPPGGAVAVGASPPAPVMAHRDSSSQQLLGPPAGKAGGAVEASPAAAAGAGAAAAAGGQAGIAEHAGLQDEEEERRQEVLRKLQGRDTQLESGLKVIDDQVDALAANTVKALGSLWGGLSTVAKTSWGLTAAITNKVETAAKEVAKELAVSLEEGASLAARAEKGLENMLGPRVTSGGGSQRSAAEWESTFESCFELFGGTTATEELEELSSECAHVCNAARAKLQQAQREQIDALLTELVPLFDPTALLQQQQAVDTAAEVAGFAVDEATLDALEALYAPVIALCNKGKKKAALLQDSAAEAVEAAVAAATAADTAASPRRQQQQPEEGEEAGGGATQAAAPLDDTGGVQQQQQQQQELQQQQRVCEALQQVLQGVRSTAVKSLAEVAAGQIMVLLTLGRSVAALPRYGKPLSDGMEWPADAEAVGRLMRSQVQHMVADTHELAAAFTNAAAKVVAHMPAAIPAAATVADRPAEPMSAEQEAHQEGAPSSASSSGGVGKERSTGTPQQQLQQRASAAASEVGADRELALSHVRDSHGKLLYVVLLASLHRAGKDAPAQEQQQQREAGKEAAAVQEQLNVQDRSADKQHAS